MLYNHKLNLIVAKNNLNYIGMNNDLLYHLKDDMKFFRNQTKGQIVVMGRNTFSSLPSLLSNRENIIISSTLQVEEIESEHTIDDTTTYSILRCLDDFYDYIKTLNIDDKREIYIIGGAQIYNQFLPYCDTLYISEIDDTKKGDTLFPYFDKTQFIDTALESYAKSERNSHEFTIHKYVRL